MPGNGSDLVTAASRVGQRGGSQLAQVVDPWVVGQAGARQRRLQVLVQKGRILRMTVGVEQDAQLRHPVPPLPSAQCRLQRWVNCQHQGLSRFPLGWPDRAAVILIPAHSDQVSTALPRENCQHDNPSQVFRQAVQRHCQFRLRPSPQLTIVKTRYAVHW
jgi:hypothetical protein